MADEQQVSVVTLAGYGATADGRHGLLDFRQSDDEQLLLAVPVDQVSGLIAAGMVIGGLAKRRLGADAPPAATPRLERWGVVRNENAKILTLIVGGYELRFEITPETVREDPESP